jgi:hypothetical protein
MIWAEFSFHHPLAYRRLLVGACVFMLGSGLISAAVQHQGSGSRFSLTSLALALPAAQVTPLSPTQATPHLTQLPGGDGTATATQAAALSDNGDVIGLGEIMSDAQFGPSQWSALDALWSRESHWDPAARNPHSGACGIPQALPCSKMTDSSPAGQIAWGLSYITARYGTPSRAWAHELNYGWY